VPFRNGALTGRVLPELIEQFLQQRTNAQAISIGIRSTPAAWSAGAAVDHQPPRRRGNAHPAHGRMRTYGLISQSSR
jgi:hypothetical protein